MNEIIILIAKYLYVLIAAAAVVYIYLLPSKKRIQSIKILIVAGIIAFVLAFIGGKIYFDTRPFVIRGVQPLFPHAADNGFPSDHTLVSAVAALIVFLYNKKIGIILLLLVIIVGISRVLSLVHSPIDIAGSLIMATIAVSVSFLIWKKRLG